MFPAVYSQSPEILASYVVATCLMPPANSGQSVGLGHFCVPRPSLGSPSS